MRVNDLLSNVHSLLGLEVTLSGYFVGDMLQRKAYLYDRRYSPLKKEHPCVRLESFSVFEKMAASKQINAIRLVPGGNFDIRADATVKGLVTLDAESQVILSDVSEIELRSFDVKISILGEKQ